jgi:hypothetical protein
LETRKQVPYNRNSHVLAHVEHSLRAEDAESLSSLDHADGALLEG